MKWISVLAAVISMASLASGHHRGSYTCRIRYSPYAFNYGSLGLIPDCLRYSPYAFSTAYPTGLVPYTVRYSPYALTTRTNGLISDLGWCCPGYWYWPEMVIGPGHICGSDKCCDSLDSSTAQTTRPALPYALQGPGYAYTSQKQSQSQQADQTRLLVTYLRQAIPNRFRISRIVSMDNQMVSFDILLEDQNVLIKYWNGQKIQAIRRQADHRLKVWNNYLVDWLVFKRDFEAAGGRIYHVASDDTYQLLTTVAGYIRQANG